MKLHVLASGSSGNCYCVETSTDIIFVDMGITLQQCTLFLKETLRETKPVSLFITHEHADHIRGVAAFVRKYMPRVYTGEHTARRLAKEGLPTTRIFPLKAGQYYDMESFAVKPFDLSHDALQPFGYLLTTESGNVGIMTDLGCVTDVQLRPVEEADILVLEANHDEEMLQKGSYPAYLKRRITSHNGHLSNRDAVNALSALAGSGLKKCLFAHVSEENNDYTLLEKLKDFCCKNYSIDTEILRQRQYSCYSLDSLIANVSK